MSRIMIGRPEAALKRSRDYNAWMSFCGAFSPRAALKDLSAGRTLADVGIV